MSISDNECWEFFKAYIKEVGLIPHQTESYNMFIEELISKVVSQNPSIPIQHSNKKDFTYVRFGEFFFTKPAFTEIDSEKNLLYPSQAKYRNITYASSMFIDITVERPDGETIEKKKHHIGNIPVMTRTSLCNLSDLSEDEFYKHEECPEDVGGVFIIDGSVKCVVSQERTSFNKPYVFANRKKAPNFDYYAEIRSSAANGAHTTTTQVGILKKKFYAIIPYIPEKNCIPIGVLFKALGVESEEEIVRYISNDQRYIDHLCYSLEESYPCETQEDALYFIGKKGKKFSNADSTKTTSQKEREDAISYAKHLLTVELFPHIGKDFIKKRYYLGDMVAKIIKICIAEEDHKGPEKWEDVRKRMVEDRDHYANKRIDTVGYLMYNLFYTAWRTLRTNCKRDCEKLLSKGDRLINPISHLKSSIITEKMTKCLRTGNWSSTRITNAKKNGVSQQFDKFNFNGSLSNLRKLNAPIGAEGKIIEPRKLHPSGYRFVCPAETPEGKSCGLIKNLALGAYITVGSDASELIELIQNMKTVIPFEDTPKYLDYTKIIVNGDWVGFVKPGDMVSFYSHMKTLKRQCNLDPLTGIIIDVENNQIRLSTDCGRLTSPLFIVENNRLVATKEHLEKIKNGEYQWFDLLEQGVVEFIDAEEQDQATTLIANYPSELSLHDKKYMYCSIVPESFLGAGASTVPYANHNQAPRVSYQCLHLEEPVLMADGSMKPIKDVKIGEKVITFDPQTMEQSITSVVNQFVRPTQKKIYQIETISGRKIRATEDHKFMTADGWKEVREFDKNTLVGISLHQKQMSSNINKQNIITEKEFYKIAQQEGIKESLTKNHISKLKAINLIPLNSTDARIPILARMSGFLLTDGSLGIYKDGKPVIQANFGSKYSGDLFEQDVESLGFTSCKPSYTEGNIHGSIHKTWHVQHAGAIASLFICLGLTHGKRTTKPSKPIPSWIMDGSKLTKREFLSGFQGGDGCRIRWNLINKNKTNTNFVCAATQKSKCPEYIDTLISFMEQLKSLFEEFKIEVLHIKTSNDKKENRKCVSLKIRDTKNNLLRYFDLVGYRYDDAKIAQSGITAEYLKYNDIIIKKYQEMATKIIELSSKYTAREIANILNVDISVIHDRQRSYKNGCPFGSPKLKKDEKISNWVKTIKYSSTTLFVPIKDIREIENCLIADITTESENHSFIAGDGFCVHNSAMSKQAIGIPMLNFNQVMDGMIHLLHTPQRPLAASKSLKLLKYDKLPCGQNAIVAIIPMMGFNQEDSVILNKSSVQRGLFRASHIVHYGAENKREDGLVFEIPKAEECKAFKGTRVDHLDEDGIVKKGVIVQKGDILIGRTQKLTSDPLFKKPKIDRSVIFEDDEYGVIEKVQRGVDGKGYDYVKVKVSSVRIGELGDKYSSRHGQKGTCGVMLRQEDMPFNRDGIVPDLIINPLALPSRMTIAQLIECVVGKRCCVPNNNIPVSDEEIEKEIDTIIEEKIQTRQEILKAQVKKNPKQKNKLLTKAKEDAKEFRANRETYKYLARKRVIDSKRSTKTHNAKIYPKEKTVGDATPFIGTSEAELLAGENDEQRWKDISPDNTYIRSTLKNLHDSGFEFTGDERLISGMTGEMLEASIFIGPTYYQRLKHMVQDKIHARARGPNQPLCRQPTDGRAHGGGLRSNNTGPVWSVKTLQVCDAAGNTFKFREHPKAFGPKSIREIYWWPRGKLEEDGKSTAGIIQRIEIFNLEWAILSQAPKGVVKTTSMGKVQRLDGGGRTYCLSMCA